LKLLDKYLFTQVSWSFLFGLTLVIVVWIAPELLPKVIREVVADKMSIYNGFLVIVYELPEVLVKSLPMGLLIGALLVFDRLSKDSEITAMRACGIGLSRMVGSILALGILATVLGFLVNETLVPQASLAQEKLRHQGKLISRHFTFVDKLKEGVIKQVVLIESYNGKRIKNIRIINFQTQGSGVRGIEEIYAAASANWKDHQWILQDGIAYSLTEAGVYEATKNFAKTTVESNPKAYKLLQKSLKDAKNMNIFEIKEYIHLLEDSQHSDEARYYRVRYHQKYSQPFASIILGIVGLILGVHLPRSSRFLGYTVGMFVILLYYFIWPIAMALGNIGAIGPVMAAWIPNVIAIAIGFIILKYKDI
jgi:lipopolysaccharide export system permease protein